MFKKKRNNFRNRINFKCKLVLNYYFLHFINLNIHKEARGFSKALENLIEMLFGKH